MSAKVIFYALSQKFLDSTVKRRCRSRCSKSCIIRWLSVIDCLKPVLTCPLDDYQAWTIQLPVGDAQRKMAGLVKFGEITLDSSHTRLLHQAFSALGDSDRFSAWSATLLDYLAAIERESTLYLMVKRMEE